MFSTYNSKWCDCMVKSWLSWCTCLSPFLPQQFSDFSCLFIPYILFSSHPSPSPPSIFLILSSTSTNSPFFHFLLSPLIPFHHSSHFNISPLHIHLIRPLHSQYFIHTSKTSLNEKHVQSTSLRFHLVMTKYEPISEFTYHGQKVFLPLLHSNFFG